MAEVKKVELKGTAWSDDRGWGINPLESINLSGGSLGNLHVVSIKSGCIRGNHYHMSATEWMLIFGGLARVAWRSGEEDSVHETLIKTKDSPAFFEIPPGIRHAIMNTSKRDIYLISINNSCDRGTVSCPSLFESTDGKSKSESGRG